MAVIVPEPRPPERTEDPGKETLYPESELSMPPEPPPPPQVPSPPPPPPEPEKEVEVAVEVVSTTSGEDKYIVREDGTQKIMGKAEIEAKGGTLPQRLERENILHQIGVTEGYKAREAKEKEFQLRDVAETFGEEVGVSPEAMVETIQRFKENPESEEFKLKEAGGSLTVEQKTKLAEAAGVKYSPLEDYQKSTVEVGVNEKGEALRIGVAQLEELKQANPRLYETITAKGYKAYLSELGILNLQEEQQKGEFESSALGEPERYVRGVKSPDDRSFTFLEPGAKEGELIRVSAETFARYEKEMTGLQPKQAARQHLIDKGYGTLADGAFTASLGKAIQEGVPEQLLKNAGFTEAQIGDAKLRAELGTTPSVPQTEMLGGLSPIQVMMREDITRGAIGHLDNVASFDYFQKGGQAKERLALDYAVRQSGVRPEISSGVAAWRIMTPEEKRMVLEHYIPPTAEPFGVFGEGGITAAEIGKARERVTTWIAPESVPPEEITVDYLNKIASQEFFEQGGTSKERMALAEAQRRAGFAPDIQTFRELPNEGKEKVVEQYKQEPVLSRIIEEKIDKPVSEFFADLEMGTQNINNPVWRTLAGFGTGVVSALGGGTEAILSSAVKSVSDIAEGYQKKAAAKVIDLPIGMTEWAGVHAPQTIIDDPVSGIPMTVGAIAAPFALTKVGIPAVKFVGKEIRELVPSKFEPTNLGMEVSIPRTQLKGGMSVKGATQTLQEMESVIGGKTPEWARQHFTELWNTVSPEAASSFIASYLKGNQVTGQILTTPVGAPEGIAKFRAAPAGLRLENPLYSVKPDILTYVKRLGETGSDITPTGSMEWWSSNFSADVAGWYLGQVDTFAPGGKMLRYSTSDLRQYPESVYKAVAGKMRDSAEWQRALEESKRATKINWDDPPTAYNILVRKEVQRRAELPPNHPEALPQGIYPVFKFHWSYEPSGRWMPTWELEYITPAGFESVGLKPTRWSSSIETGGKELPKVASLDTYSPIQGMDKVTGQSISLGEKMPVAITATKSAIAEGKGVPTLADMYAIKFLYKPLVSLVNLFTPGKAIRPRARMGETITTPRKWYSRVIKLEDIKEAPADINAKSVLAQLSETEKLSTTDLAAKLGEKIENGRIVEIREPYAHPLIDKMHPKGKVPESTDFVMPRVAAMVEHPNMRGSYIVFNDTHQLPNVWDIGGGQIDPRGTPRVAGREFGSITLQEALREQFLSEIGVDLKNIKPAKIFEGKTTEHSQYGTYMFDAIPSSLDFKITPGEVRAIRILKSGDTAAVTPALYLELQKRGFDVTNLYVFDKDMPTAGIKQFAELSKERNVLESARKTKNPEQVSKPKIEDVIYEDKTLPKVEYIDRQGKLAKEFREAVVDDPYEYLIPYKPETTRAIPSFVISEPTTATAIEEGVPSPSEARAELATRVEPITEPISSFEESVSVVEAIPESTVESYAEPLIESIPETIAEPLLEPNFELKLEPVLETTPEITPETPTEVTPETTPEITPEIPPPEEPLPEIPPETPPSEVPPHKPPNILRVKDKEGKERDIEVVPGTLVWIQGRPQAKGGGNAPMYKVILPPYRQENKFSTRETPPGYVDEGWEGKGSAFKSIKVVGGYPTNNVEGIDLGFVRVSVDVSGEKPKIEFVHDEDANVGAKHLTVGMGKGQIPIEEWEEAKAQGISYTDFIKQYQTGSSKEKAVLVKEEDRLLSDRPAVEGGRSGLKEAAESMVYNESGDEDRPPKKPKNLKNWWESEMYEPVRYEPTIRGRYYRGRKLLPPNLGGEI